MSFKSYRGLLLDVPGLPGYGGGGAAADPETSPNVYQRDDSQVFQRDDSSVQEREGI